MNEKEWRESVRPLPMLMAMGTPPLLPISKQQCRLFVLACAKRFWTLPLDEPSRTVLLAFEHLQLGSISPDEFVGVCRKGFDSFGEVGIANVLEEGMGAELPLSAGKAAQHFAWGIANIASADAIQALYPNADDDDWFGWSFFGGPPVPEWHLAYAAEERYQANVLREIVDDRYQPHPPGIH